MKIEGTITAAEIDGDTLRLDVRGWCSATPEGFTRRLFTFAVHDTASARQTYHVGREVTVTLEPKR